MLQMHKTRSHPVTNEPVDGMITIVVQIGQENNENCVIYTSRM